MCVITGSNIVWFIPILSEKNNTCAFLCNLLACMYLLNSIRPRDKYRYIKYVDLYYYYYLLIAVAKCRATLNDLNGKIAL